MIHISHPQKKQYKTFLNGEENLLKLPGIIMIIPCPMSIVKWSAKAKRHKVIFELANGNYVGWPVVIDHCQPTGD